MIDSLVEQIEARFAELEAQMSDPEVIGDRERYAEVGREYRDLQPANGLAIEYRKLKDDLEGARELLAEDGEDAELLKLVEDAPARPLGRSGDLTLGDDQFRFATFPAPYFNGNMTGPFIDQVVGTMFLVLLVVAVIDMRNSAVKSNLGPLVIGFAVAAIGISYGANAGYAINPARDFGPRLFAWMAGWGNVALPGTVEGSFSWYFWVPIIGPLLGGIIGIFVYDWFIGDILHARAGMVEPVGRTRDDTGFASTADEE